MQRLSAPDIQISTGPELLPSHLPAPVRQHWALCSGAGGATEGALAEDPELRERFRIQQVLAQNDNRRARAASALGISRVTLYKKMKNTASPWQAADKQAISRSFLRLLLGLRHGEQLLKIPPLAQRFQIVVLPHLLELGRRLEVACRRCLFQQPDSAGRVLLGAAILFRLGQLGVAANGGRGQRADVGFG